jgi:GTP-binding protein Era
MNTRCGFVSIIGRPNVGKSTLLNALLNEKIALVSHKADATRKRLNAIVMHDNDQIIFVDTPGLHEKEKLLNQFMLQEAIKAIGDSDIVLFLADVKDEVKNYENFLSSLKKKTPHILVLNKIDKVSNKDILKKIDEYKKFQDFFLELIPISALKPQTLTKLLNSIVSHLPKSPYLYEVDLLTTQTTEQIYKEFIRESIFNGISDEIPYESDVIIDEIKENNKKITIKAKIIVEKSSQKSIIVGKQGATIKRIGINARKLIENFANKKCYLELFVKAQKGWSKNKKHLAEVGYYYN